MIQHFNICINTFINIATNYKFKNYYFNIKSICYSNNILNYKDIIYKYIYIHKILIKFYI